MLREMLVGTAAGAVGTVVLNGVTYGDMVVRGRPPSSVPSQVAGQLVDKLGIDLSAEDEKEGGPTAQNRKSGLGALQGFAVGLGIGTAYGLIRPHLGDVSKVHAGTVLCLAAMLGSDGPAAALGVVDPRQWGLNSWLSDIVPHLAYGLATAASYDTLAQGRSRRRL
jgi:hypothetical protein